MFKQKKMRIASMLAVLAVFAIVGVALAATPFRETVTLTAGSGTNTLSRSFVGTKITHVQFAGPVASTSAVYIVSGTTTNLIGSKVIAANDTLLVISNAYWLFKDDTILVTSSSTNSQTAYIVGEIEP